MRQNDRVMFVALLAHYLLDSIEKRNENLRKLSSFFRWGSMGKIFKYGFIGIFALILFLRFIKSLTMSIVPTIKRAYMHA